MLAANAKTFQFELFQASGPTTCRFDVVFQVNVRHTMVDQLCVQRSISGLPEIHSGPRKLRSIQDES